MKKDIKDYLHLYLGCNCRFRGQELKGKINQENLWKLFSVTQMDYGLVGNLFALGCTHSAKAEEIYPILRPLSDMTEEEKGELGIIKIEEKKFSIETHFESFRLLLSKHFDLFGLIEAGLAIDKTKPNSDQNRERSVAKEDQPGNKS